MSKEQDFYKAIEQSNAEEKELIWEKIETQRVNENEKVEADGEVLIKSKKPLPYLISIPIVLILLGVGIFLICKFTIKNDLNEFRYCTFDDYYISETDLTIKQYNESNEKDMLYFDWYDTTEYYADSYFRLNSTDEIICHIEEIVDENDNYITLYVTDKYTEIDILKMYSDNCLSSLTVGAVEAKWGVAVTADTAYTTFSYNGSNYYVVIEGKCDQEYIEYLLKNLID